MRKRTRKQDGSLYGFLFCLASSAFYTLSLLLLRLMTNYQQVSLDWTLCLKESVTVLVVGTFILVSSLRGRYRRPTLRTIGVLILAGLFCELIGARSHLKSYALIGIVLAAPLMQSFQLIGTAGIGALFLREKVTWLKAFSILLLIVAVALLSLSPMLMGSFGFFIPSDTSVVPPMNGPPLYGELMFLWGIFATLLAGLGYSLHLTLIRSVLRHNRPESGVSSDAEKPVETPSDRRTPISAVMFLVTLTGMIVFGSCLMLERGFDGFWRDIPSECWGIVLLSGVLNLCGYYFQNRGIELVSAATGALVAVSQICLLTVFGILFFHEPSNALIWLGLAMTIVGVLLGGLSK